MEGNKEELVLSLRSTGGAFYLPVSPFLNVVFSAVSISCCSFDLKYKPSVLGPHGAREERMAFFQKKGEGLQNNCLGKMIVCSCRSRRTLLDFFGLFNFFGLLNFFGTLVVKGYLQI